MGGWGAQCAYVSKRWLRWAKEIEMQHAHSEKTAMFGHTFDDERLVLEWLDAFGSRK